MKQTIFLALLLAGAASCTLTEYYVEGHISTADPHSITDTSAVLGGTLSVDDHGSEATVEVSSVGVEWWKEATPDSAFRQKIERKVEGEFSVTLSGLQANSRYSVKAYAEIVSVATIDKGSKSKENPKDPQYENRRSIVYGDTKSFTTSQSASVTFGELTVGSLTTSGASVTAVILTAGNPPYTERGVCYSSAPNPTVSSSKVAVAGSGVGSYTANLSGLSAGATYHVRAYAANASVVTYSMDTLFTTLLPPSAPTITASSLSNVRHNQLDAAATLGALTSAGVADHGFCYAATSSMPTTGDAKVSLGAATQPGQFTATITGLQPKTKYYVRAYAVNNMGTAYGDALEATTTVEPPVVSSGLVAYYTFDDESCSEAQGKAEYNGVKQGDGTPTWSTDIPGAAGKSLELSNNDAYYQIVTSPFDGKTEYTVNIWLKAMGNTVVFTHPTVSQNSRIYLEINGGKVGGYYSYGYDGGYKYFDISVSQLLLDGGWHMLTCTYKSSTRKLYIDGTYYSSLSGGNTPTAGGYMQLGSGFTGKMDNLRIYNRELTQAEITEIYSAKR